MELKIEFLKFLIFSIWKQLVLCILKCIDITYNQFWELLFSR